jgi:parallel beta-helix repeat protein
VIKGTDTRGITVAAGANTVKVTGNRVTGGSLDGIFVGSGAEAVLRENVVKGSDDDGILVNDDDTLIEDNRANGNHDNGIDSASANGSGNVAKNNDNDPQCNPASLCS